MLEVKVGPLQQDEERYFIDDDDDDDDADNFGGQPLAQRRSCIRSPELRRYELPRVMKNGLLHFFALWFCVDTGSVGWPFSLWLFSHIQARGGFIFDPWHAEARDLDNAWARQE